MNQSHLTFSPICESPLKKFDFPRRLYRFLLFTLFISSPLKMGAQESEMEEIPVNVRDRTAGGSHDSIRCTNTKQEISFCR
jgi:hypothetical protein